MPDRKDRVFLLFLALGPAAGCGRPEEGLTIHSGAGLKPPVEEAITLFGRERGLRVAADYAGSEVLLSKIKLSRRGDVYLPGESHYLDLAEREGLVRERKTVCYFVPTILVRKGNPLKIEGLRDLFRPGIRVGVGDARINAVGRQTLKILARNGLEWPALEKNVLFQSATAHELGLQIQAGSLDAVIVWDAVAAQYARHGEAIPIPPEQNVITTVDAAVLSCSRQPRLARELVDFLASDRGREIFRNHHYRTEPPDGKHP